MNTNRAFLHFVVPLALSISVVWAEKTDSLSQHGITWTFAEPVEFGQYVTGDYWVVGPVEIISITNSLNAPGFEPRPGQNGSMVNPGTDGRQGYDDGLGSYSEELNAARPGGNTTSKENPLILEPNSSLVSAVSWLYRSKSDAEPGTPRFSGATNAPRSAVRSAAVLTVVAQPPAEGSFRPPYCGTDKSSPLNLSGLDLTRLPNLAPSSDAPSPDSVHKQISRPWIDHVYEWMGAEVHPTENMPNYGRDMARILIEAALLGSTDFSALNTSLSKQEFLIPFLQIGIDFAGIADNGGSWPPNGGHHAGRKHPILFAGVAFDNAHMKGVGTWDTMFQEDAQTFIVSQAEVDISQGPGWDPDSRGHTPESYTEEDIGLPEWGIRHATLPNTINRAGGAKYREINNASIPGFALIARLLGAEDKWDHPPLFAYADRVMKERNFGRGSNSPSPYVVSMWDSYNPASN